jgi:hypothetical protein
MNPFMAQQFNAQTALATVVVSAQRMDALK